MPRWQTLTRSKWRTPLLLGAILGAIGCAYLLWSPGAIVRDGRHDRRTNAIWLQHGWLADDSWFQRNPRDKSSFRDERKITDLAELLRSHGVKYVFPHVSPCAADGTLSPVDPAQTARFLDHFGDFQVIPWVGGVLGNHCFPESPAWRTRFVASALELLQTHPRLAGIQLNLEPLPSGNADFLTLLDELRAALPAGKILSVAAYPPPTRWHPQADVHWDEPYFRQVAMRADQLAPMMYDTALNTPKLYQQLLATWTTEILTWSGHTQVLLGVPVYADAGTGYHSPQVENLHNALAGIHAGLLRQQQLPPHYAGIAIYCEWEMDRDEWAYFKTEFERAP